MPEDATFVSADVEDISWGGGGGGGDPDNGTGGTGGTGGGDTDARGGKEGVVGGVVGRGGAAFGRLCGGGTSSICEGDGDGAAASTSRWAARFDLLVGADGPQSFVRNEAMLASLGAEAAGAAAPGRRGYVVYRGVCSSRRRSSAVAAAAAAAGGQGEGGGQEGWGLESFQTWGPGLRFASVPLAGDERVRWTRLAAAEANTRIYIKIYRPCIYLFRQAS